MRTFAPNSAKRTNIICTALQGKWQGWLIEVHKQCSKVIKVHKERQKK